MKCPFDKKCEECIFNTRMYENADGKTKEVWRCAISWIPVLLSEISQKLDNKKIYKP